MLDIEYHDARMDLHRDQCPDEDGPYEALYIWQDALEGARSGEHVPPWLTQEQAIAQAEEHVERLREELES